MKIKKNTDVIIINYNSTDHLNRLIKTLTTFLKPIINNIFIIDNNSNDFQKFKYSKSKNIIVIKNKKNVGFAKAVNQGIKISKNKFILLLNPDTKVIDQSIINCIEYINNDDKIGIIGGKIKEFDSDNFHYTANTKATFLTGLFEFTNLKKIFPNNFFSKKFWPESHYNFKQPSEVDSLCGAFIIFRKKINNKLNLFNEKYFLYMEDVDFGNKNKKMGYKVILFPQAQIEHIGGASSNSKYNIVLKHWYKSRKIYFKKHLNRFESKILSTIFNIEELFLETYHYLKHQPND